MVHGETEISDPYWARLLFIIGYWFLGSIVFSLAAILGLAQLIVLWIWGRQHEGLESFSASLASYACHCLSYIVFAIGKKPFPLGPLSEEM